MKTYQRKPPRRAPPTLGQAVDRAHGRVVKLAALLERTKKQLARARMRLSILQSFGRELARERPAPLPVAPLGSLPRAVMEIERSRKAATRKVPRGD